MNARQLLVLAASLLTASIGFGQSASLVADKSAVASGAELTLTASATYEGTPSAMGWSVTLPAGWSYVSTTGPDVPAITPQAGATGTIEWAFTESPAGVAHFRFTVKATGKAGDSVLKARVLLRAAGKQQTVEASPVAVSVTP
ncbi:MAG: hypothetical protein HZA93_04855 [Verrucomicrobia bacterium]|nr:hypothetical protein [Verrucomicrobiota bacterium]